MERKFSIQVLLALVIAALLGGALAVGLWVALDGSQVAQSDYGTACYREQGGNVWVCGDGGAMRFEAGSTLTSDGAVAMADLTLSGDLGVVNIAASGDITAVNALLSGDLDVVDITAAGDVSAVNATLTSDLGVVNITATGDITAVNALLSGDITAVNALLSGDLDVVNLTASGDITAAGDVSAVNATLTSDLGVVNITATGDITAVNALLSGDITAVNALLSGDLDVVNLTASGDITAGGMLTVTDEIVYGLHGLYPIGAGLPGFQIGGGRAQITGTKVFTHAIGTARVVLCAMETPTAAAGICGIERGTGTVTLTVYTVPTMTQAVAPAWVDWLIMGQP